MAGLELLAANYMSQYNSVLCVRGYGALGTKCRLHYMFAGGCVSAERQRERDIRV